MIRNVISVAVFLSISSSCQTMADPLEDAYKLGYKKGYADAASIFIGSPSGNTIMKTLPGPEFKTIVVPPSGTKFDIGNDSAVAIVPHNSLDAFKQKLGTDFIIDNKILLNK